MPSIVTNTLMALNTSSSLGMFARDTGGCLLSRLSLSRSKDESREISIAEISESAIFYFSAPALARLSADRFSKAYKTDVNAPFSNVYALSKNAKLAKLGRIGAVFGTILPAVFLIAPIRNYVTQAKTGKDKFTQVVELDKTQDEKNENPKEKCFNLIKKLTAISGGSLIALFAFLKACNSEKIYKMAEPFIEKAVKHFDFTKTGDLELMHYAALIYPVSIASYFYSCRDKYEVNENLRRFSITVPLMLFGEKLIQNPIHRAFDKKNGTKVIDNMNNIMSYDEILKMPKDMQNKYLKTKNWAYGLTFLINTMCIAGAVALLNRIKTKQDFDKENNRDKIS